MRTSSGSRRCSVGALALVAAGAAALLVFARSPLGYPASLSTDAAAAGAAPRAPAATAAAPASLAGAAPFAAGAEPASSKGGGGSGKDGAFEMIGGAEVVWKLPTGKPVGTLFVAHGCSHSALDWLPKSDRCPKCIGLPEELNITRYATEQRGLALVAVSSADRAGSRCWDTGRGGPDVQQVKRALKELLAREALAALPLYALGASSGGAFVLALAAELKLDGVCSEIMASHSVDEAALLAKTAFGRYPPTAFAHMPRDARTARGVAENARVLKEQGVPVKVVEVHPVAVTAEWLAARVPELAPPLAGAVVAALAKADMLGPDGMLKADPRQTAWRDAVRAAPGGAALPTAADASGLSEVLNVAWARHEIASSPLSEVLDFFEASKAQKS
ncbi:MAG: hypothetical protein J3K34DRAFT_189448 [Monoraphidium minutum]|nr:MAG: hypothetical protein J3K34DRAFT_189448 [Monoraphidium minutum]